MPSEARQKKIMILLNFGASKPRVKGGPGPPGPPLDPHPTLSDLTGQDREVADIAKRSCASEASKLWPGSRARLRALEAFGFLMLKYAFSHILGTLFL